MENEDVAAQKQMQESIDKMRARRRDLFWAIRTRILTVDEMDEIRYMGPWGLAELGRSYGLGELETQYNELLLNQFYMRLSVERGTPPTPKL